MPDTKPMRERIAEARGRYGCAHADPGLFVVFEGVSPHQRIVSNHDTREEARAECARLNVEAVLEVMRRPPPEVFIAAAMALCRLQEIEYDGHWPENADPEMVLAAVIDAIKEGE